MPETDSAVAVTPATVTRDSTFSPAEFADLDRLAASLDYLGLHYREPDEVGDRPAA